MRTLLLALLLSLLTANVSAQKWTLKQCVDYALQNNVSVRQADVQARLSKLTLLQSKAYLYPSASGSVNSAYQHGLTENPTTGTLEDASFISGNVNLQTTYNIFTWGARRNTIAANKLYLKADQTGIEKAQNDIALAVANAFLQVMLRREQARISEVQVNQSLFQLDRTRKLVKAGSQPELNAIQIEAQLSKDSSALLQAQSLVEQAMINLKAYMNYDFTKPLDIEAPDVNRIPVQSLTELQPESVYQLALTTQPTQKMYNLRIEASKLSVKAARGSMYPSLAAFGGLSTRAINTKNPVYGLGADQIVGYADVSGQKYYVYAPSYAITGYNSTPLFKQFKNNFGQDVGLGINFSLFNNRTYRTEWERAKQTVQQYTLQLEQENLNLKATIYNAYQDAFASLQKYNAATRTVAYSQKAFDFSKKRFDIGLLGSLDYIITQNNLFTAQIEEVSSLYDYIFKMKVLEFYKGQGISL